MTGERRASSWEHQTTLPDGSNACLRMFGPTIDRLLDTMFYPGGTGEAGTFRDIFHHPAEVLMRAHAGLVRDALRLIEKNEPEAPHKGHERREYTHRFEEWVGWEPTIPIDCIDPRALYRSNRNNGVKQRISWSRFDILAPATRFATIAYDIQYILDSGWIISVSNVYPGPGIGGLSVEALNRGNRAVFPTGHPGEPINEKTNLFDVRPIRRTG